MERRREYDSKKAELTTLSDWLKVVIEIEELEWFPGFCLDVWVDGKVSPLSGM